MEQAPTSRRGLYSLTPFKNTLQMFTILSFSFDFNFDFIVDLVLVLLIFGIICICHLLSCVSCVYRSDIRVDFSAFLHLPYRIYCCFCSVALCG